MTTENIDETKAKAPSSEETKAEATNKKPESTAMYTAGFVLGIIGVVFAFIPGFYWVAYILGILALVFGIIGLVKKVKGYKPVTATVLGAVALVVGIVSNIITVVAINAAFNYVGNVSNEILNDFSSIYDETTDEISDTSDVFDEFFENYNNDALNKTVAVSIDGYQEVDDFWSDMGLVVTLTNISDETHSFTVNIEALDANGNRIDEDSVSVSDLAPGQSFTDNAFTLSSLDESVLAGATFRVYRATSY